jgi:uncharacterized protein (DUF302 family)
VQGVDATVAKLQALIEGAGARIFALIDHSGEAAKVGMPIRNTKLLVFGNPALGSPLMQAAPVVALDLPLKILVWEDANGQAFITYNSVAYLFERYELPMELSANITPIDALAARAAG